MQIIACFKKICNSLPWEIPHMAPGHKKLPVPALREPEVKCDYRFFIFILRAARVSTSRTMYRQPMVTKIALQPNFS